jgi:hypothetical protein
LELKLGFNPEDNKGSDVERIERVRDERHKKVKGRI